MEIFIIKALQLIFSLSILVIVHEFGHFVFAKLFKIRVEKFYLFFNVGGKSLFKFKPKNSDTEFGIGWLPLGGYVKLAGMIDESMDTDQMNQEVQSWEFRAKPAWQRLIVMFGGVLFNIILAVFIYAMMFFAWGDKYINTAKLADSMYYSSTAKSIGFQDGDAIVSVDGKPFELRTDLTMFVNSIMQIMDGKEILVLRDGKEVTINIPPAFADSVLAEKKEPLFSIIPSSVIFSIAENSPAEKAGLRIGDKILSIDTTQVKEFTDIYQGVVNNLEKTFPLIYLRGNDTIHTQVTLGKEPLLGVGSVINIAIEDKSYSFFESFPVAINRMILTLKSYVSQFRFVFSTDGLTKLSGFGGIGSMFAPSWNWGTVWSMTAFLSIAVAFFNILPIPALDGGHIMFLLYEVITRKKPSQNFMEKAQLTGMFLLLLLMLIANGNDVLRFLGLME